jgi:transcriptional regulator with XRE-family HTH domain
VARIETGNGKTLADLAKALGVARSTVEEWIKIHPEFSAAIEQGRIDADDRVERALYERAVGYEHPEEKLLTVSQGAGMPSVVERHKVTAHYPPDPTALKFWLTNRRRARWSERSQLDVGGKLTLEQLLAKVSEPSVPSDSTPAPEAPQQ